NLQPQTPLAGAGGPEPTGTTPAANADTALPADVLQRVKKSTVYIEVTAPEGLKGSGSGFFCLEPGIVVTNAHVAHMKQKGSPKPKLLEVFVDHGMRTELKLKAEVL